MNVNEAAQYLGLSINTVRKHISNGDLVPDKRNPRSENPGGFIMEFSKSSLDRYKKSKQKKKENIPDQEYLDQICKEEGWTDIRPLQQRTCYYNEAIIPSRFAFH